MRLTAVRVRMGFPRVGGDRPEIQAARRVEREVPPRGRG